MSQTIERPRTSGPGSGLGGQWRGMYTSWYQVPVLYVWNDVIASGRSEVKQAIEQEV